MSTCFECQSLSNFICSCSGSSVFMCKYHISSHLTHSQFVFIYYNNNSTDLQIVVSRLENQYNEIETMHKQLKISHDELILSANNAYSNAVDQLRKSQQEIKSAINFLKDLKHADYCKYANAIKFIVEPELLIRTQLVLIVDYSKNLCKKLESCFRVESTTSLLLEMQILNYFDEDYFRSEKEKAITREKILKKYEGCRTLSTRLLFKMFHRNMNKRSLIPCLPRNQLDVDTISKSILPCLEYSEKIEYWHLPELEDTSLIIDQFFRLMDRLSKIGFLSLKKFIKSKDQLGRLFLSIQNKKVIKHVYLKDNLITAECLSGLLQSFNFYKGKIRTLNISMNFFSDDGCSLLNQHLPGFTGLRDLNLSYNEIGAEGIKKMSFGLSQVKSLEELNIKNNQLKPEGLELLILAVSTLPRLSVLNVSNNQGFDEGVLKIAGNLKYLRVLMILFVDFLISLETVEILKSSSYCYTKIYRCANKQKMILIQYPDLS